MKDFLQPDSKMSLQNAAEALLQHCSSGAIVSIIQRCAYVTSWHHRSHLKLAYLAERIGWSKKMSANLDHIQVSNTV
jgi:hypothetical protein